MKNKHIDIEGFRITLEAHGNRLRMQLHQEPDCRFLEHHLMDGCVTFLRVPLQTIHELGKTCKK